MLAVAYALGLLLAAFALTFALPIACSLAMGDGLWPKFLLAAALAAGCGLTLAAATARLKRELRARDGFLLVTLGWLVLSAAAAVPLLLALPSLSFTGAYFEAMSGLTTTGSTVLTGLDALPPSLNFWRASLGASDAAVDELAARIRKSPPKKDPSEGDVADVANRPKNRPGRRERSSITTSWQTMLVSSRTIPNF